MGQWEDNAIMGRQDNGGTTKTKGYVSIKDKSSKSVEKKKT